MMHSVKSANECDKMVKQLFGWCEQWDCNKNCTCVTSDDCKQFCSEQKCQEMFCRSPTLCTQRLHVPDAVKLKPHVGRFYAESPTITQNCANGKCDSLLALKNPKNKNDRNMRYFSLQNCVEGECKDIIATTDVSKQFCSNVNMMHCHGDYASNCTQTCVVGKCSTMKCEAKFCEQSCSYKSNCAMECPRGVKQCRQKCDSNSTCTLKCDAKRCIQNCNGAKECKILQSTESPTAVVRTKFSRSRSTLSSTAISSTSKVIHTSIGKSSKDITNEVQDIQMDYRSSSCPRTALRLFVYFIVFISLGISFL